MKEERDKEIKKLKKQGIKQREIAKDYDISEERVSQIIKTVWSFCGVHNRRFVDRCIICDNTKKFQEKLTKMKKFDKNVLNEILRLSRRVRTREVVLQRRMLVKKLREEFKLSFLEMGRLFNRHHTSIMSLYEKNKNI